MSVGVASRSIWRHFDLDPAEPQRPQSGLHFQCSRARLLRIPNRAWKLSGNPESASIRDSVTLRATRSRCSGQSLFSVTAWLRHGAMLAACLANWRSADPLSRDQGEMSARSLSSATRPSERCCVASCFALGHEADRPIVAQCVRTGAPSPPPLSAGAAICKGRETKPRRYPHRPVGHDASRFRRRAHTPLP
jgi:hypothetical protein